PLLRSVPPGDAHIHDLRLRNRRAVQYGDGRPRMKPSMKKLSVSFVVGLVFALGLGVSGMTQPQKVIGFLDPTSWDPTLLFVMMGAVGVHALAYPLIRRRRSPLLD